MMPDKEPSLLDVYQKLTRIETIMSECLASIKEQHETLYGASHNPETGLVWRMTASEKEISLIRKVAFVLVPSTGVIWTIAEMFIRYVVH